LSECALLTVSAGSLGFGCAVLLFACSHANGSGEKQIQKEDVNARTADLDVPEVQDDRFDKEAPMFDKVSIRTDARTITWRARFDIEASDVDAAEFPDVGVCNFDFAILSDTTKTTASGCKNPKNHPPPSLVDGEICRTVTSLVSMPPSDAFDSRYAISYEPTAPKERKRGVGPVAATMDAALDLLKQDEEEDFGVSGREEKKELEHHGCASGDPKSN
jgi:hypothetical protein